MAKTAKKTDPKLWDKVKQEVTEGDKGGKPGQWSARKAQLAVGEYKQEGGGYQGAKSADNSLSKWGEEEWGTKSGEASGQTGERYLPKASREKLSDADYKRTTEKKRADTRKGKQFSAQPEDVAKKTAADRTPNDLSAMTRQELMQRARQTGVKGRSGMNKQQLLQALRA